MRVLPRVLPGRGSVCPILGAFLVGAHIVNYSHLHLHLHLHLHQCACMHVDTCSCKRVKGRSHSVEERISTHSYNRHATSKPSLRSPRHSLTAQQTQPPTAHHAWCGPHCGICRPLISMSHHDTCWQVVLCISPATAAGQIWPVAAWT